MVKEGEGGTTVVEPGKWSFATAGRLAKVVADLQFAAIIDATGGSDDDFNPATATLDKRKAYVARMGVRLRGESKMD